MKGCDKHGQMKLSFGMIFSIILIIIFLIFTFYAIRTLLRMNDSVTIGKFYDSIQGDVDNIWQASQGSQEEIYPLPGKIKKVCFIDYESPETGIDSDKYEELSLEYSSNQNIVFFPLGSGNSMNSGRINHIDLDKITENNNPLCFENIDGKVSMNIEKEYGEQLATIN